MFNPTVLNSLSGYYSLANEINSNYDRYLKIRISKNDLLLEDIEKTFRDEIEALIIKNQEAALVVGVIKHNISGSKYALDKLNHKGSNNNENRKPRFKEG